MTLAQLQAAQQIDAATVTQLENALEQLGIDPTGYTVEQIQAAYQGAATQMQTQGAYLETVTGDKKLEAERTGHAYAAIIGVNFSPNEDLNVGFRYESKAAMTLKNDTKINTTGRTEFDDGEEFGADMPALAAFGLSYKMNNKLKLETSLNYFFDENVDWDKREKNLENAWEIGLGAEYMFTEDLCGSVGVLKTQTAASEKYRTDLDYGLDSYTVGFGIGYKLTDTFKLDFGALNTFYIDGENAIGDEEYYKNTMVASIGMSYKF
jgi:long-chain fatty acid transport protein